MVRYYDMCSGESVDGPDENTRGDGADHLDLAVSRPALRLIGIDEASACQQPADSTKVHPAVVQTAMALFADN